MKEVVLETQLPGKRGLYDGFLSEFESKLNPVSLVQILSGIVRSELESSPAEALAFLTPRLTTEEGKPPVVTANPDAHVFLLSHVAILQMRDNDNASAKKSVATAREMVDAARDLLPSVHSSFYRAAAEYHKIVGTASDFFRNALQFVAYTPPESLSVEFQRQWAFDIGIAALVGTDIYNFGEVLDHAIIRSLKGTDSEWLLLLLEAFNKGNLAKFEAVSKQSATQIKEQPVLVIQEEFLQQKIRILALMELAFSRALDRSIAFSEVEKACSLPAHEVEYLLMRSMSLGVVSGVIDNVDQSVCITRVQPRVLGREPIGNMSERLSKWCSNVGETVNFLKEGTTGLVE